MGVPASPSRLRITADRDFGSGTPATWYIGLSVAVPNLDNTGFVEPVGLAYVRVASTNSAGNWPAATTVGELTQKLNGAKITWPNPTGTWGTILAWGAYLASTGGVPEFAARLDSPITVKSGNTPVELDIGMAKLTWSTVA